MNEMLKRMQEYMDSPEGKRATERYWKNYLDREVINDSHIERFHQRYGTDITPAVERIVSWYNSDRYRQRERKLGREPLEGLYSLLLEHAEKYGREATPKEIKTYCNSFTVEAYVYQNWLFHLMQGQGACIMIVKLN